MKGIDSKFCKHCFQNYPLSFIELGVSQKLHLQLQRFVDGTSGAERNAKKEIEQGGEGGRGRVCGNEFKIIHSHEL
jgi:hypothetical protein